MYVKSTNREQQHRTLLSRDLFKGFLINSVKISDIPCHAKEDSMKLPCTTKKDILLNNIIMLNLVHKKNKVVKQNQSLQKKQNIVNFNMSKA